LQRRTPHRVAGSSVGGTRAMNRKNVQDLQRRHDRLVRRLLEQIEATRTAVRELLAHEADMPDDVLEWDEGISEDVRALAWMLRTTSGSISGSVPADCWPSNWQARYAGVVDPLVNGQ